MIRAVLPTIICLLMLIIISTLDRKIGNPYYQDRNTREGGIIVNGIPIPLVKKRNKISSYNKEQINAIKERFGEDVNVNNILRNKRWIKFPAARSIMNLIASVAGLLAFFEIQNAFKDIGKKSKA